MNLDSVAIWHPSDSNGVVLGVRLLAWHHREPDPLDESNEEDEEFSFDKGFSHAHPLSMTQGHKVVRSEELPLLVEKPFSLWGKIKSLV